MKLVLVNLGSLAFWLGIGILGYTGLGLVGVGITLVAFAFVQTSTR